MTYPRPEALVETEWLAAHLDDPQVRIVDASFKLPGITPTAREDYDRGPHHPYYELLSRSVPELRRGWIDEVQLPKTEIVA